MRELLVALVLLAACAANPNASTRPAGPRDTPALLREAVQDIDFAGRPTPPGGSQVARAAYVEAMMDYLIRRGVNVGASARGTVLALTFTEDGVCDERFLMSAANMLRVPLRSPGFTAIACEPEGRVVSLDDGRVSGP